MKVKMTIVKDVVKSTGRQITVEVTGNDRATIGRLKQIAFPYQITRTFDKKDSVDYILESMKSDIKVAVKNFRRNNDSLVHISEEFNI